MNRPFQIVALVWLAAAPCLAQTPQNPDEQALAAKARAFSQLYGAKNFDAARQAADETIALARTMNRQDVVAAMLYNKACLAAVTGRPAEAVATARAAVEAGYTNYYMFASDSDFDSLRENAEFRSLLADVKARSGIAPHEWETTRTSRPFPLMLDDPDSPPLQALRREFATDQVVAGKTDGYGKLLALTEWVSRQWQHSPTAMASKPDPTTILREARAGGRFICRDYAIVLAGVARAHDLPARVLNLLPRDVETRSEAHSVAEVWVERFGKWVLADGQYGIVAERDGVPLSGVELQRALAEDDRGLRCAGRAERCAEWKPFILRNAFYFKTAQDQRRYVQQPGPQLVLVPKGAPDPHKFAGGNEEVFAGSIYISDPRVFYAAPGKK